jgi:hypothetical protein
VLFAADINEYSLAIVPFSVYHVRQGEGAVKCALYSSLLFILCWFAVAETRVAPLKTAPLTDSQVQASIDHALHGKRHQIGLRLNDVQTALFSGLACKTCQTSGYTIWVYTAESWIEAEAVRAQREMMPFSLASVTDEMRQPYIRVLALPSTAEYLTGEGMSMSSSVHRVVLSSTNREDVVQPLNVSKSTVESNSAFRSYSYTSAGAVFSVDDVERLRSKDQGREFFIVVVGDNNNKYFKVKTRFFAQLFGKQSTEDYGSNVPASTNAAGSTAQAFVSPLPSPTESSVALTPSSSPAPAKTQSSSPRTMSVTTERPNAGVLGISGANWSEGGQGGIEIIDIATDSPADIAGLHLREVITDVNGRRIRSIQDLAAVLAQNEPGSKIVVGYIFRSTLGWMPSEKVIILADK